MNKAIFLDRDGVLNAVLLKNGLPHPPASAQDMQVLPGVRQALEQLHKLGYLRIVVTNQPDIARGTTTRAAVDAINAALNAQAPVDAFYVCPHDSADACQCRKPKPGLITDAARDFNIDLSQSFMVGDRWRDIDAGRAAGVRTFFVLDPKSPPYAEKQPSNFDWQVASLPEAVQIIETTQKETP